MKILICNDFPIFLKVSLFFFLELTVPTGFQHNKVGMSGGYEIIFRTTNLLTFQSY